MALISPQAVPVTGVKPTYAPATGGGDTIVPDPEGRTILHYKNGSGGSITVTQVAPGLDENGQARADIARAIPAGEDHFVWVNPKNVDPSTGLINLTYSGVTSLTVAALRN